MSADKNFYEEMMKASIFVMAAAAISIFGLHIQEDTRNTSAQPASDQVNISLEHIYGQNPELKKYYNVTGFFEGCKPGYGYSVRPSNIGLGLFIFDGVLVGVSSFYGPERGHYPWTDQENGKPVKLDRNSENSSEWQVYTHTLLLTEPPTKEECKKGKWDKSREQAEFANISYENILALNPGYRSADISCEDCDATDGYGIPERCVSGKGHYVRPDPLPGHALYVWDGKLLAIEETWDKHIGWRPWADGGKENVLKKKYGYKYFYKQTIWLKEEQKNSYSCESETFNYSKLDIPYGLTYNDRLDKLAEEGVDLSDQ